MYLLKDDSPFKVPSFGSTVINVYFEKFAYPFGKGSFCLSDNLLVSTCFIITSTKYDCDFYVCFFCLGLQQKVFLPTRISDSALCGNS